MGWTRPAIADPGRCAALPASPGHPAGALASGIPTVGAVLADGFAAPVVAAPRSAGPGFPDGPASAAGASRAPAIFGGRGFATGEGFRSGAGGAAA
ncbi:MAG TPA: hypothetical protein PK313_12725, partial [Myxococcota bacterium]|nr:hypothetical protein [Myxococcota bacterium]